jgi:hypothetical protein
MDHQQIEDDIARFYSVTDHIRLLTEQYIDSPKIMTEDEVWNHLSALEAMVELYTNKLMDTYCRVYQLNQYASEEVKAKRAALFGSFEVKKAIKDVKKEKEQAAILRSLEVQKAIKAVKKEKK